VAAMSISDLDSGQLAQLLFACPVQPSEQPSPAAIRMALATQFRRCQGDLAKVLGVVAQEAGDHPDSYAVRMRWAIRAVAVAGWPGTHVAVGRAA